MEKKSTNDLIVTRLMRTAFARQAAGIPGRSPEELAHLIAVYRHRGRTSGPENSAAGFHALLKCAELSGDDRGILQPLVEERVALGCLLHEMPPSLQRLNAHWREGFFFRDEASRAAVRPAGTGSYRAGNPPSPLN